MKVTLRHLEAFLLVHKFRSLTRAAQDLRVTQSAVSILIRQLEQAYGLRLFDRTTRALSPTAAATQAVPLAERIVQETASLSRQMHELADARSGRVLMAVSAAAASAIIPTAVKAFRAAHPDIVVEMHDVAIEQLVGNVLASQVEFGIGSTDEASPGITVEPLIRGRLCAIGLRASGFGRKTRISWDRLAGETTIAMRRETRIRAQIDGSLAQQGKQLTPTYEVSLINTALSMTAEGIGITILPSYLLPARQFPSLVAVPLVEPTIHRQLSLIRREGQSPSPAAERFIAVLREQLRSDHRGPT